MMAGRLAAAVNLLRVVRAQTDCLGIAFSGGKDSHVVVDLAADIFPRLVGYYLYRVADLEVIARLCRVAERRWRMRVIHYPHFDLTRCYRHAVLQPHWPETAQMPTVGWLDIEARFRAETGSSWIAYGWRRSDSLSRALILTANRGLDWQTCRVFPVARWSRRDVLAYLRARHIPRPPTFGRAEQGGVDFHADTIRWLDRYYPADAAKLRRDFPHVEIQARAD
jgi:3'-phosphoadenosine 5'-phosphosulfate sulfotransferase (PAPS reductase)/FAD synthetase